MLTHTPVTHIGHPKITPRERLLWTFGCPQTQEDTRRNFVGRGDILQIDRNFSTHLLIHFLNIHHGPQTPFRTFPCLSITTLPSQYSFLLNHSENSYSEFTALSQSTFRSLGRCPEQFLSSLLNTMPAFLPRATQGKITP